MTDRDDFADLVVSAKQARRCSAFLFNGRIRYGIKNDKTEERFLCMDAVKVCICSTKIPVKIESQFNILSIKLIERLADAHIIIETDERQVHSLYGLHERASLQPFLLILIRCLHAVFPHRLQAIVEIRPENEYDKLLRLANDYFDEASSDIRPCGGFSLRYECACDFYQVPCHRSVQYLIDTVFAHRLSREFTFREFESLTPKDYLPILGALRYNQWFTKLTIENMKLTNEVIEELCTVVRLCRTIKDLRLINCGLRQEFAARFNHCLAVTHVENIDLSNNALEDKGLTALNSGLQQRKLPLRSLNLSSCSITHKGLQLFNNALISNPHILKTLQILNLAGNRIKDENCIATLFSHPENVLEELHLTDIEFSLESFFSTLAYAPCKLRRCYLSPVKSLPTSTQTGGVKLFFTKISTLEILQIANANLSNDFLRELCDGLHSNISLSKLDLRLTGNPLESFVRDHAAHFATIPCVTELDLTGCDLDNEMPTLLNELKKNRKLKALHLGKNFNNIKPKYMPRVMHAIDELLTESDIEHFSVADSRLKENLAEFLPSLTANTSLKILDIRGNAMGDVGVRELTRILQINGHLHTIYFDRNFLSLNNFEDIVNAMEENYVIEYLPIPITDIILMKTTEKDRMEKLQSLMSKLDSLCTRNQSRKGKLSPIEDLQITTTANLTREMTYACDSQQLLLGDQTSLEYIHSCSNRSASKTEDIQAMLTRTARIAQISSQLYDLYRSEEEQLTSEWQEICEKFGEKLLEKNQRLSKKFYQLFKEQSSINYDDKFQEQIRTYFSNSNDRIHHLLQEEIPSRLTACTRECYINVATSLQKRAYDTTNDLALDMHRQLEAAMFQIPMPSTNENQPHVSTLDRLVNRGANVVHRFAPKHHPTPADTDEWSSKAALKSADSNEQLNLSPKPARSALKVNPSKPATSPRPPPPPVGWRRSVLTNSTELESDGSSPQKRDRHPEDEGDLIEHEILDIVEQEQLKDQRRPPHRTALGEHTLDLDVEQTNKLNHLGKSRPRPANRQPRARRPTNGGSHDSSSDGGLDNDETSITESSATTTAEQPTAELPPKAVSKIFKPTAKSSKDEPTSPAPPPVPAKTQLQSRLSSAQHPSTSPVAHTNSVSKPKPLQNNESTADATVENLVGRSPMSLSTYASLPTANKEEQKEKTNSAENLTSPSQPPPVSARTGKIAVGPRVLPALDPNSDPPAVKLRPLPTERKAPPTDADCGDLTVPDDNEQYKRLSVKERARMLTTPNSSLTEKKSVSPSNPAVTSPYSSRTPRRLMEQVNLFC